MRSHVVFGVVAVLTIGAAGCGGGSSSSGVGGHGGAGTGGSAGSRGSGGAAGGSTGSGGAAGAGAGGVTDAGADLLAVGGMTGGGGSGSGGVTGSGGSILDAGVVTVSCPTTVNGALETTDPVQTGRESRFGTPTACGPARVFPGNGADTSNLHFYDGYRFVNPSSTPACFNFTLTYDSGSVDGSTGVQRYLTAYSTYDPLNIGNAYLGDVGATVTSPQTMSITVPAGSSIDVVVFAIDVAPAGTGSYVLSCATGSGDAGAGGADGGAGGSGGNDGGAPDSAVDGAGGAAGADGGSTDGSDGAAEDAAPDA